MPCFYEYFTGGLHPFGKCLFIDSAILFNAGHQIPRIQNLMCDTCSTFSDLLAHTVIVWVLGVIVTLIDKAHQLGKELRIGLQCSMKCHRSRCVSLELVE